MRRVALLVLLVLISCSSRDTQPEAATPPPSHQEAPLNQALAGLDGVMGDLQRILVRERRITSEVTDRLQAIYTGPAPEEQRNRIRR